MNKETLIYLDHAATTPMAEEVIEAMLPFFREGFGNPSSIHQWGRRAKSALDQSRNTIAQVLGTEPNHIIFTSGGTESDNLAIIGVAFANQERGRHIITTQIEHHAILHACEYLERFGFEVTYLSVDRSGKVSLDELCSALRPDTILVSIMYGNNEVGTIQDIQTIGNILRERNIYFHTDAVQVIGTIPINLRKLPVDMLSISAHKLNGPKGVGALVRTPYVKSLPLLHGGAQEKRRRAGTENVAGIVGFAKAIEIQAEQMESKRELYQLFRKTMIEQFTVANLPFIINGHPTDRLPHILNISFIGTDTESLLFNLDLEGIAASSGSACTSGSLEPSHVLQAMHLSEEALRSAIRFSFGSTNTLEQIEIAAKKTIEIVQRLLR